MRDLFEPFAAHVDRHRPLERTPGTLCEIPPLAVAAIIAGAAGVAGAGAKVAAGGNARKRNRNQLNDLLDREATGDLGLTDSQQEGFRNDLISPIQQAASESRQRNEALGATAAGEGFGARELALLRRDQAEQLGRGGQAANAAIFQADEAQREQDLAQIEARLALQRQMRNDTIDSFVRPIQQAALGAGGAFGNAQAGNAISSQFDTSQLKTLQDYARQNPDQFNKILTDQGLDADAVTAAILSASTPTE